MECAYDGGGRGKGGTATVVGNAIALVGLHHFPTHQRPMRLPSRSFSTSWRAV
jgi:hypothetical protein